MSSTTPQRVFSTPTKASDAPAQDSPGNWRHPRFAEITQRQNATTFSERNAKNISYNLVAMGLVWLCAKILRYNFPAVAIAPATTWAFRIAYALPLLFILFAFLPVVRPKDDFSDIPLTPGQRKLLGLPPSATAPTPGSVYSTPPKYSRTPSLSGSASGKRSFSASPGGQGSPLNFNSSGGGHNSSTSTLGPATHYSPSPSPLLHRAIGRARRSSIGSLGSPSVPNPLVGGGFGVSMASTLGGGNFGATTSSLASTMGGGGFGATTASSLFGGGLDSPSPSPCPANGKRSSVGLNSKWLYERGRKNSGSAWLHT